MDRNDKDYKLAVKFLVRSWDSPAEQTIGLAEIFKGIREEGREEERKVELDRRAKMKNDMI